MGRQKQFNRALAALRRKRGTEQPERIEVFPDATVVRFDRRYASGREYTYAAVWIQATNLWNLTGAMSEGHSVQSSRWVMRHTDFLNLLADPTVSNVCIATEWVSG